MFLLLFILVLIYSLSIYKDTKGITFFSPKVGTDNEKMLLVAFQYGKNGLLRWPGSVHYLNEGKGRAELREFWIIFISVIQKFFANKRKFTEHVNISLGLISQSISTLLIYILSCFFLPNYVAFLISIIYLSSSWCTEVILYLGHIIYSQIWFLISLIFILLAYSYQASQLLFYCFILFSGITTSICFTSSSASRKFPPIIVSAQFYLSLILFSDFKQITIAMSIILVFAMFLITPYIMETFLKFMDVVFVSRLKTPNLLSKKYNKYLALNFFSPIISISLSLVIPIILSNSKFNYIETQFVYGLGMLLAFMVVLMPSPFENIKRYITFLDIGSWASHFEAYPDQKKTFGKTLPSSFRGAGLSWLFPFFITVMPIELFLFSLTLISMFYCLLIGEINVITIACITLIGVMPTLIVEITKGLQVGKSYLSSLTGFLITIVLGYKYLEIAFAGLTEYLITFLAILQIIRFFKIYKNDLLPCRMCPARLRDFLSNKNLYSIYTYDTDFNNQFVDNMIYGYESKFDVNYVNSIKECPKNAIFVVPPTSSKSVSMETTLEAILNGDYRKDPVLNSLLDSNSIQKYSIAKFKSLGNSKFYVNESEVTSYRYHILKQVTDHDKYLSYGWVLDLELLNNKKNEL